MPPPAVTLTKGLKRHKCSDCGIALKEEEVGGAFVGGYLIDYLKRTQDYIDDKHGIEYCSECLERIKAYRLEDQGQAIMRRLELERDESVRQPEKKDDNNQPDVAQQFTDEHPFGLDIPDGTGIGM